MTRRVAVVVAVVTLAALTAILAINALRGSESVTTTQSPTSSLSPSAYASVTPPAAASPPAVVASPTQPSAVRPDSQHGVIVATGNLRTEDDQRGLQQPSLFLTAPTSAYAVSADGKRIAMIRTSQTGQQIVTFTTAKPNDITTVIDLAGSGESVTTIVWAGDGDFLVYGAVRVTDQAVSYAVIRSVDVTAHKQSEIARVATGVQLVPVAWRFDTHLGGALETEPGKNRVLAYDVIRDNSLISRTPLDGVGRPQLNASRDGRRILVALPSAVRWWPVDKPATAIDLHAGAGEPIGRAAFRPGTDEIGADVGRNFEIWTLTGQRRVVGTSFQGFQFWRVDGSAAIISSEPSTVSLLDPATGTIVPLPGGGFPVADVVLF